MSFDMSYQYIQVIKLGTHELADNATISRKCVYEMVPMVENRLAFSQKIIFFKKLKSIVWDIVRAF